jgi:hypothetical protein
MDNNVIALPGCRVLPLAAPKRLWARPQTMILTPEMASGWKTPHFHRALRVNGRVRALAQELKRGGGVLPGVLTIGAFEAERYLVDGLHRVEAFRLSGMPAVDASIRICFFETSAEMARTYVEINSRLA